MFLFWIFFIPLSIQGQRFRKGSPLDILRKRFASGEINNDEYQENKKILENEYIKLSRLFSPGATFFYHYTKR